MSMQELREKFARNRGAVIAADPQFWNGVENEYDQLKAKNAHPSDFRRLRSKVAKVANGVATAPKFTAKDQPIFDGLVAFCDMMDEEVNMRLQMNAQLGGGGSSSAAAGGWPASAPSSWVNAQTGEPVRVFDRAESVADRAVNASGASVGEIIAAKLFGTKSPAIQAALSEGTDSAGGYTVPVHTLPQFIDKLRSQVVFIRAGARTLILDTQQTKIARISGDPTATWRAESSAINVSDPTFSAITFNAKSLAVIVKMSRELLQDSVNIADAIESAMLNAMSLELDRACLFGSGSSNQPLGLAGTSGVGSTTMGTNGASLGVNGFAPLLDAVYQIELANSRGITAAIWHPRTSRALRGLVDSTGQPLRMPSPLDSIPQLATTAVPINQVKGTSGAVCSSVYMGYFPSALVGIRENLNIQMLPELYAATGEIGFVAHLRADVQFEHPEEFCILDGIKP